METEQETEARIRDENPEFRESTGGPGQVAVERVISPESDPDAYEARIADSVAMERRRLELVAAEQLAPGPDDAPA